MLVEPNAVDPRCSISDYDLYLLGEGNLHRSYECMGAHVVPREGVRFVVWAPHARRVSVVGDFNDWDAGVDPMRPVGGFGLWMAVVSGARRGHLYKYRLETAAGVVVDKSDPYAFASELRPGTASVVHTPGHEWSDGAWMERRSRMEPLSQPAAVYEVHLGSWRRDTADGDRLLSYRETAVPLVEYVKRMGFTHVELLPITEHPFDGSWGYQVTGYFAPTRRFGDPDDFAWFVDYCHQNDVGVILDWVPSHFPKDAHGLARFDGTALYEYEDTRKGEHREWGTLVFNYARNEVRNFLLSSALFWLDRYHVDGLRVDAVASMLYLDFLRTEWEPNEQGGRENLASIAFLRELNQLCHRYHPGVMTIAEDSSLFPGVTRPVEAGGLGFTLKWNMGWMNDTLRYIRTDPLFRKHDHDLLLIGLRDAYREKFILPISHDEVVHLKRSMSAKMPGDLWQQMAGLRLYYGFMWTHPGKKLLFMGQEFGQWREWSEAESLDWHLLESEPHRQVRQYVADLNRLYRSEPCLYRGDHDPAGFQWLESNDRDHSVIVYLRLDPTRGDSSREAGESGARRQEAARFVVVICNFTPVPRLEYRIGVPRAGEYSELLNSDDRNYGGSGMGNHVPVVTEEVSYHGQPHSIRVTVPPLAILILHLTRPADEGDEKRQALLS